MKIKPSLIVFMLFLISMFFVEISEDFKINFVKEAEAIIGVPISPVSVAGVARRSTRRVVRRTAVATTSSAAVPSTQASLPTPTATPPPAQPQAAVPVSAIPIGTVAMELPKGCQSIVVNNASYSECAGAFYKTALQGNNFVYVVVDKPL